MKPVFKIVLTQKDGQVGPLEDIQSQTLNGIGGTQLLNLYSSFSVGTAETADHLAKQGRRVIVGVTDRFSREALLWQDDWGDHVANGRQTFFPLADGTWLGVMGSGKIAMSQGLPIFMTRK